MNKLLIILLSSLLSLSALADKDGGHGKNDQQQSSHPEKRLKHLKEELSLTDQQASEISAIMKKSREEARQFRANIKKKTNAEIMQVLTPEQQKQFSSIKQERKEKAKKNEEKKSKSKNSDDDSDDDD